MAHPNSGTCNIKYINYTDSETKTQREDMEILPKDRTPAPEGGRGGGYCLKELERVLDRKDEELF